METVKVPILWPDAMGARSGYTLLTGLFIGVAGALGLLGLLLNVLPEVAVAPLLVLWFGFGLLPKALVVALVTFFPITVGWVDGFAATERAAAHLLRSMGATSWQVFRLVRLPGALPAFFSGLRIAITYAVVGAIFAEYAGAKRGLGIFMQLQQNAFRTDLVMAAVVVTAVVSVALFLATYAVERVAIPWHAAARASRAEDAEATQ